MGGVIQIEKLGCQGLRPAARYITPKHVTFLYSVVWQCVIQTDVSHLQPKGFVNVLKNKLRQGSSGTTGHSGRPLRQNKFLRT